MLKLAYWVVLLAAAAVLFVAVWIVIPIPGPFLLPFGVGAPEISPVLFAASTILAPVAAYRARKSGVARLALVLTLTSAIVSIVPLAQVPSAVARFDSAMAPYRAAPGRNMKEHAVNLRELFMPFENPEVRTTKDIEFAKPDGIPLKLDVYQPPRQGLFPVVVQIYGGSWQNGSPASNEAFARHLASVGYVVAAIDYRHAPQWRWPEQLEDVRAAFIWVSEHARSFDGDPTRIAIVGRSAGAQLAMRFAFEEAPSSIKAVVNFYGPVDLADGWRHPPVPDPLDVRGVLETFLGGRPDQVPERYRHASPISYASGRVPPTLHLYGKRDHIVEARFGRLIDHALRRSGNTSILLELPWAEHAFDIVPNGLGGQISLFYTERFLGWALSGTR